MGYGSVKFGDLTDKRKAVVRETIAQMWADGFKNDEIAKKVRISRGSVAAAVGNFERMVYQPKKKVTV